MIRKANILIATTLASVVAIAPACRRTAHEDEERAAKAQHEGEKKIDEAQRESTTKITSAQQEVDKKVAAANVDFVKNRDEYKNKMTADLTEIDKRIEHLEAKAKTAEGKAKADLDAALPEIRARRQAVGTDLTQLDKATMGTWDATKSHADSDWEALKTALDKAPASSREMDMPGMRMRSPVAPQ